jgi:ElaB/YqjD/DUF883 family membrane-anchored ribosome-binding protein
MNKYDSLIKEIQILRERLHELINKKSNLKDSEIIDVSKKMDALLNEYEKTFISFNKKDRNES